MSNLAKLSTKELKSKFNDVLGQLAYTGSLKDFDAVSPYLAEFLKRGYVSTARYSTIPAQWRAFEDTIPFESYQIPTFVAYQTPFSKVVNYNKLLGIDDKSSEYVEYGKCGPDGEAKMFVKGEQPVSTNCFATLNGSAALDNLIGNDTNRPYGFHSFDQLYSLAKDRQVANSVSRSLPSGVRIDALKLRVLPDNEVAEMFDLDADEAKYYLVFGLRQPKSPHAVKLTEDQFENLASEDGSVMSLLGLGHSTLKRRADFSKGEFGPNIKTDADLVDKHFGDFKNKVQYDVGTGVDVSSINKRDFDQKYERANQTIKTPTEEVKTPTEDAKTPTEDAKAPTKSNALWWIVGGVAVSSAVYLAHKKRKSRV